MTELRKTEGCIESCRGYVFTGPRIEAGQMGADCPLCEERRPELRELLDRHGFPGGDNVRAVEVDVNNQVLRVEMYVHDHEGRVIFDPQIGTVRTLNREVWLDSDLPWWWQPA